MEHRPPPLRRRGAAARSRSASPETPPLAQERGRQPRRESSQCPHYDISSQAGTTRSPSGRSETAPGPGTRAGPEPFDAARGRVADRRRELRRQAAAARSGRARSPGHAASTAEGGRPARSPSSTTSLAPGGAPGRGERGLHADGNRSSAGSAGGSSREHSCAGSHSSRGSSFHQRSRARRRGTAADTPATADGLTAAALAQLADHGGSAPVAVLGHRLHVKLDTLRHMGLRISSPDEHGQRVASLPGPAGAGDEGRRKATPAPPGGARRAAKPRWRKEAEGWRKLGD